MSTTGLTLRGQGWPSAVLLCLLTVAAYVTSFTAGFVLDSRPLVLDDPRIRQFSPANLSLILHKSYWWPYTDSNLFRPVTTLSYLVNYGVLGNETHAFGYHLVNLAIHLANVLLVYALAVRLSRRHWPAFFGAAIWAVHPLSTEAVTNIVGRADLLAACGVLATLYAYVRHGESRGARATWLIGALAAATFAMFSKESGAAALGLVVLYGLYYRRPSVSFSSLAAHWAIFLLPIGLFFAVRAAVIPAGLAPDPLVDNPIAAAGFLPGRLTALAVAGRYLWLAVWPARLSSDYSFAEIPLAHGSATDWLSWIIVCGLAAGTALLYWRSLPASDPRRLVSFALASAFMAFLPASNLLVTTGTIMGERLFYLPLAGVVMAIVVAVYAASRRLSVPMIAPAALCGLAVVAGGVRTSARNLDWRDEVTLWASAARVAPGSFKAHQGLADTLYERDPSHKDLARVIAESERSLAILDPLPDRDNVAYAYRNAAGYQLEHGDALRDSGGAAGASSSSDASLTAYRRSVALITRYLAIVAATHAAGSAQSPSATGPQKDADRELGEAYVMLATGHSRLRDTDKALDAARRAQSLQPMDPVLYRVMASALIDAKRFDEAMVALLAGFTVTGDPELRQATIDFYRAGGDPKGCAIRETPNGPALDQNCETVHRHLCAATMEAIRITRASGRKDFADRLEQAALPSYHCAPQPAGERAKP